MGISKFDKDKKIAAMAMAEATGKVTQTAERMGIAPRTLKQWRADVKDDPELAAMVEEAAEAGKWELIQRAAAIVGSIGNIVEQRVTAILEDQKQIQALTVGQLRDLSVTGGIWADKLAVFSKEMNARPPAQPPGQSEGRILLAAFREACGNSPTAS